MYVSLESVHMTFFFDDYFKMEKTIFTHLSAYTDNDKIKKNLLAFKMLQN